VILIRKTGPHGGYSDPQILNGMVCDHKLSYARDNSLITTESSYRCSGLGPRCWIGTSWWLYQLSRV